MMTPRNGVGRGGLGLGLMGVALMGVAGCREQAPTRPEEILRYVKNGVAGAPVRRLDDPSQAYVTRVFKAYRAWKASIDAFASAEVFWDRESPNWRDEQARRARSETIAGWLIQQPDSTLRAGEALYQDLLSAIDAAPGPEADQGTLPDEIRLELEPLMGGVERAADEYYRVASAYRALLDIVSRRQAEFDPRSEGLVFTTPEAQEAIEPYWETVRAFHQRRREARIMECRRWAAEGCERRQALIDRKRALSQGRAMDEDRRREWQDLELAILYHDRRIEEAERLLRKEEAGEGGNSSD